MDNEAPATAGASRNGGSNVSQVIEEVDVEPEYLDRILRPRAGRK